MVHIQVVIHDSIKIEKKTEDQSNNPSSSTLEAKATAKSSAFRAPPKIKRSLAGITVTTNGGPKSVAATTSSAAATATSAANSPAKQVQQSKNVL